MGTYKDNAIKVLYHFFTFFFCPFLITLSSFVLFFFTLNYFAIEKVNNYQLLVSLSANFAFIVAFIALVLGTFLKLPKMLLSNKGINSYAIRHFSKHKLPIKTRMRLKPYFLIISLSMFLIVFANFIKTNQTGISIQIVSWEGLIFFISYGFGSILIMGYFALYTKQEEAIFYFDQFFRYMNTLYENPRIETSAYSFEKGLKAYQKVIAPNCTLVNLKERVRQMQLLLDRGSKEELSKAQLMVHSLSDSIKEGNAELFSATFANLSKLFDDKENKEKPFIQINTSRKEKFQGFLSQEAKDSFHKVLPFLLLTAALAILYFIFGSGFTEFVKSIQIIP